VAISAPRRSAASLPHRPGMARSESSSSTGPPPPSRHLGALRSRLGHHPRDQRRLISLVPLEIRLRRGCRVGRSRRSGVAGRNRSLPPWDLSASLLCSASSEPDTFIDAGHRIAYSSTAAIIFLRRGGAPPSAARWRPTRDSKHGLVSRRCSAAARASFSRMSSLSWRWSAAELLALRA